jgi:hypothetical protein
VSLYKCKYCNSCSCTSTTCTVWVVLFGLTLSFSILFYDIAVNDFPRYFQAISGHLHDHDHHVIQNSCLHGGGSIPSLVTEGNAMWPQFETENAVLQRNAEDQVIYDYGACTVPQLLTGVDNRLADPGYASFQDVDPLNASRVNLNPCRQDPAYLQFATSYFDKEIAQYSSSSNNHYWDYVLINDNTKNPARGKTRQHSLAFLETFYVPWLQQTQATPVFLWTHAYPGPTDPNSTLDLTGLHDIANFTSLTGVGYRAYADMLHLSLPASQQPRIAPVGLAFLLVHEEDPDLWAHLFHSDGIHASPSGTFLQGCIIHHTVFGELPPYEFVVRQNMASLWKTARMMQHSWDPPNPFPTTEIAQRLYDFAQRIVDGEIPKTYIDYQDGETAYGVE